MKMTAIRLHLDIRTKSETISLRKPYFSILITHTPVGIQQDYTIVEQLSKCLKFEGVWGY